MTFYYQKDKITLYNIDCLEWLKSQATPFIDLCLTSPPYDNIRKYNGFSFEFESIAKELYRNIKDGGILVWNVADSVVNGSETGTSMRQAIYFMDIGFKLHDTMIYAKKNPMPSSKNSKRYHQSWEYLFVLVKGNIKTFNPIMVPAKYGYLDANMKHRGQEGNLDYYKTKRNEFTPVRNIFEYSVGGGHSTKDKVAFNHPAIMPEKLAQDMINSYSNPDDLVFDPFLGSGTTAKICLALDRKFVGTEISAEYCDISKQRLENWTLESEESTLFFDSDIFPS